MIASKLRLVQPNSRTWRADFIDGTQGPRSQNAVTETERDSQELLRLLALSQTRKGDDYLKMAELSQVLRNEPWRRGREWTSADTAELDCLLAEYRSLRQESLSSVGNRVQALVFGLASVAAVSGALLTRDNLSTEPLLVAGVFSIAIPLFCLFVYFVWMSEAIRSHRVGYYLAAVVEARINQKLERLTMAWEASLWTRLQKRDERFGPSMVAVGLVGLFGLGAPWFGVFLAHMHIGFSLWQVWVPYGLYGATFVYSLIYLPRLKNKPEIESPLHVRQK